MSLAFAPFEKSLKIVRINADEKTGKHLNNLGLTVGRRLTLLSASGGDCIVKVMDGRLALNRSLAMKLLVDEES